MCCFVKKPEASRSSGSECLDSRDKPLHDEDDETMKRQLVIVGETIRQTDQRNLRVFALTLLEGDVAD